MTEPTELLPCPFCGGAPTTIERPDNIDGTQFFYAIACYCGRYSACAHKMAVRKTPEIAKADAVAAWNTRTPQPTQAQAGAVPLTDEQIDAVAESMPGGLAGFLKGWGWRQFAREILTLRRMPDWEPQFDCMTPKQEELAIQFCQEIAGPRGERGSPPDPVRLLEMAEALYKAEREHRHGIKGGQHVS